MKWMIFDGQFGSTGKGLIAGYLAKRRKPTAVVCAWGPNAGHTYIDADGRKFVHRMIPNGIVSPSIDHIFIGPGAVIDPAVMVQELQDTEDVTNRAALFIHENAAVVLPKHVNTEKHIGLARIGSTLKGTAAASIDRMLRDPHNSVTARQLLRGTPLEAYLVDDHEYMVKLTEHDDVQIEGSQGYSLSMYHGFYPYVTSRDVTPWQIAADCGLPFSWAQDMQVVVTLRTFPIRVNNREGSSGPAYWDQREMQWEEIGQQPELTTVTQLPRRLFSFSPAQLHCAMRACASFNGCEVFLNFANYLDDNDVELARIIDMVEEYAPVRWLGEGPTDRDVKERK